MDIFAILKTNIYICKEIPQLIYFSPVGLGRDLSFGSN